MTPDLVWPDPDVQAREPVERALSELRTGPAGLSQREAERRLAVYGPNALPPPKGRSWLRELSTQLLHPLALLLWVAAALAFIAGTAPIGVAIVVVVVLNAGFALVQEHQAQRAIQALSSYLPDAADVIRDRQLRRLDARDLVPGDVIVLSEGDRVSADARLFAGSVLLDMSMLTGETDPVERRAGAAGAALPLLALPDLIFSGTLCTAGEGQAVVLRTGLHTEIGRIASLTQHTRREMSPLERKVRQIAWLIAGVGTGIGAAFLPLGLLAGLSLHDAALFAIGLLVANVPEGLLPTITLALAAGVRTLARQGAVVKRLSAVETLGSTTVICTDKTGTLTQNRMTPVALWTPARRAVELPEDGAAAAVLVPSEVAAVLIGTCLAVEPGLVRPAPNDPTEIALAELAQAIAGAARVPIGGDVAAATFRFDPDRKLSSATVGSARSELLHCVKGAPEVLLDRSDRIAGPSGVVALDEASRRDVLAELDRLTGEGLRLIGLARRSLTTVPQQRDEAERQLTFLAMIALHDPPRPEVADAVADCHRAGLRIHIVTGDNGRTAAHVARSVGIGKGGLQVVAAAELDALPEAELDALLTSGHEIVFARSTPLTKLRVADALKALGEIVAMTGDGVNDAPALHRADIGVAMGRSGTEVAREAATLVLTDDNFASVVTAIRSGRQVFDNVRKFVLYIFAHAVPEVVPFLVFALSGGAVPLPLTVMQILAIDLGTETLPALALGREAAEPGTMDRPPRPRRESVITGRLLVRAWLFMGVISAALVMGAFWFVLWRAGWHPGDPVGKQTALHHAYRQATTAAWAGLVACQVGTAFGARVDRASLRQVGIFTNRLLLWGIAFELAFACAVIWLPPLQSVVGTEALDWPVLALIAPFPLIVWGADELRRWQLRRTLGTS